MNTITITIKDTNQTGKVISEIDVSLETNRLTLKEIIEARVTTEVDRYNSSLPEYFQGLVQPTQAETTLNGYKMKHRKKVDSEKQIYIALDTFLKNGYFILIDKFQASDLDQEIEVSPDTQINFIKLIPLVGG